MTGLLLGAGMFFAVSAVGSSTIGPFAALACGWFAGRVSTQRGTRRHG